MTEGERKYLVAEPIVAWGAFAILLATYWLTVAPSVSFWDCPEYVSAAYLLEVGHPPGNPTWMLVERMVTLLVPARYAALAVNLSSGLLTAFAAFFLAKTIFRVALWILLKMPRHSLPAPVIAAGAALVGALAFGWCDSVWYSAVEAEVYAMSIFMTSLCVWLMAKWAGTSNRGDSWRLLVLIAYLFGLSIGIHQLNLLCIPALAMIWAVRRGVKAPAKLLLILVISLIAVACVLAGMMPSTIALAAEFELIAVNKLHLPLLSGVVFYVVLLALSLLAALWAVARTHNRITMASACFPAIFLSGVFIFSEHFIAGAVISALAAVMLVVGNNFQARRLYLSIWMLAMLLTGYSSYALIPLRGDVAAPSNSAMPGNPFAFAAYQSREQYGSKPLIYGQTPFSKPLMQERFDSAGKPSYTFYEIEYGTARYIPKESGARLKKSIKGLAVGDSLRNIELMERDGDAYIATAVRSNYRLTPELDMWFPRITASSPFDLRAYSSWAGMDTTTMTKVAVSEAVDSTGNFVTRLDENGERREALSYRPTYLQNLRWLIAYQSYYMYGRYLLWNFFGRQNDRPSQGEVQHGNFITGFTPVDNLMLGAEERMPDFAGKDNKGRNRYYGLPFLLGLLGMAWLIASGRRGRQAFWINALLFFMTGLAIVFYLNQTGGEPRERDYSFLGSYMAFSIYITFGAVMLVRWLRSVWAFVLPLGVVVLMGCVNFDDHDRSNRDVARNFAISILESADPDAIIFVNGDNYTFPLWYAQEVEGVRTDVRVVNLSYLTSQIYAANLMADWRDSKSLPMTLNRGDIIWDTFRAVSYPYDNKDTVSAPEALRSLRNSENPGFPVRYVTLRVSPDSVVTYDLRSISKGRKTIDFGKLMMFDIIATNSVSSRPRPVYWLNALGTGRMIGLYKYSSPWLYGRSFGIMDENAIDSLLYEKAMKMPAPNVPGRKVYMDFTPSVQVSAMRAAMVHAAERLLKNGRVVEAVDVLTRADVPFGDGADTYKPTVISDSLYDVKLKMGKLLIEGADSLDARAQNAGAEAAYMRARSLEMRARGMHHLRQYAKRKDDWERYREALPPHLRKNFTPLY